MGECQLVFARMWQESKARKMFWLFKPEEVIAWEPFDLHLTFRNDSDEEFHRGKCAFEIREQTIFSKYEIEVPSIKPNEKKTVRLESLVIRETGAGITNLVIRTDDGKMVTCRDKTGELTANPEINYRLFVVSREELYQKYSVILAIFFSTLASILTIVNVLVSIFT